MEQRILQYRKQIDEWLTEMEQNVQTLSQHGEYSTQAVQRQTHTQKTDTEKTDIKKTDTEEQTMQEMVQDKLKEHLVQVGFFQHERLIHLIVTVTFALLEMLAIVLCDLRQPFYLITPHSDPDPADPIHPPLLHPGERSAKNVWAVRPDAETATDSSREQNRKTREITETIQ